MYNLVVRECEKKHPILSSIVSYFNKAGIEYRVINVKKDYKLLKEVSLNEKVIISDPIVGILCRLFGLKIDVFFSLELFEHQVVNNGIKNKLRNKVFKFAHLSCLKRAKEVIFPSEARLHHYSKTLCINIPKVKIIPNYPSQEVLDNIVSIKYQVGCFSSLLSEIGVNDLDIQVLLSRKKYIYPGTLDISSRGVKELIDYFSTKLDSILILAGPTKNCDLKSFTIENNTIYLGVLSRSKVLEVMSKCENGILYYDSSLLNTELCCPVKIFEYLNMGLDVTATCNNGLEEYKSAIENFIIPKGDGITFSDNLDFERESKDRFVNKAYEDFLVNVL